MEKTTWKSFRMSEADKQRIEELRQQFAEERGMDMSFDAFLRYLIFQGIKNAEKELQYGGVAITDAN